MLSGINFQAALGRHLIAEHLRRPGAEEEAGAGVGVGAGSIPRETAADSSPGGGGGEGAGNDGTGTGATVAGAADTATESHTGTHGGVVGAPPFIASPFTSRVDYEAWVTASAPAPLTCTVLGRGLGPQSI